MHTDDVLSKYEQIMFQSKDLSENVPYMRSSRLHIERYLKCQGIVYLILVLYHNIPKWR